MPRVIFAPEAIWNIQQYMEWLIDFGDSGYVAHYRIDGDTVTILAVRHQKEVGYTS
ncbi:plasmid stabilization protein (plasmid) [Xylella fastidiosa]|uniref:type II toxin-antitoxin system RelE/ParE family toxin n=1 Tax=Xylella fastidiosa TaxID=2371 RepID=UPI00030B0D0E|nr:type II toxin-antitoxin system RelE/ParE family toxin [Xylella fastidiosa]ALQ96008.1 plasmid stabilization protein [Xylella fastidiosa]ALR03247.1 plasmid stabilization protein [Xylella fastidiosa]KXB10344.1 plasmid stabilization protein [Xylella fastidiosa]KXB18651.1 plasmid stabilization protein [Xylella fastidiosa]MDG5824425.1 type II toxin-antitoxin system RelE/ParE family toxin [Xylella fastidiosa subsp. pauca]